MAPFSFGAFYFECGVIHDAHAREQRVAAEPHKSPLLMNIVSSRGFVFAILATLAIFTYGKSLPNSFQFDDFDVIVENPAIRDLKRIPSFFTDTTTWTMSALRDWRPIVLTTFAINFSIGGIDPFIFRLTNLGLHLGVAYFLFLIFKDLAARRSNNANRIAPEVVPAFAVYIAALFLVHTANSEVVHYIFARSTLLATFFYVTAFYCYLRGPFSESEKVSARWPVVGLCCFILGVGAKGPAVTLPLALMVFEIIFLNPASVNPFKLFWTERARVRKYLPLAVACIGYVAIRQVYAPRVLTNLVTGEWSTSSLEYFYTQLRAWVYYLKLFLWPDSIISDYPGFGWSRSFSEPAVLMSAGVVVAILAIAWLLRKRCPIISFFIFWYFIVLLPEASFIPLSDAVNGYRSYASNIGFSVVLTLLAYSLMSSLWDRFVGHSQNSWRRTLSAVLGGLIICGLSFATIRRGEIFRDPDTYWSYMLEKDPTNPRAYLNLGVLRAEAGNEAEAGRLIEKAASLASRDTMTRLIRGEYYFITGRDAEAMAEFDRLAMEEPRLPRLYYDRAELHRKLGAWDKALADFDKVLSLRPLHIDALNGKANVFSSKGDVENSIAACNRIIAIDRFDERGHRCLAEHYEKHKRPDLAIRAYQDALALTPNSIPILKELANLYGRLGMSGEEQSIRQRLAR